VAAPLGRYSDRYMIGRNGFNTINGSASTINKGSSTSARLGRIQTTYHGQTVFAASSVARKVAATQAHNEAHADAREERTLVPQTNEEDRVKKDRTGFPLSPTGKPPIH
jgi:hypothetical protein